MTTANHTVMVVKPRPVEAMQRQREQIKQEIAYGAALELVWWIELQLRYGRRKFYWGSRELFDLYQIVNAILAGELVVRMDGAI